MQKSMNRVRRTALLLGIALVLPVLSLAFPMVSQAMLSGCRGDPIITLSNGAVVDVYVDITTDATNVKSIEYDVHVPAGVSLVSSQTTPTVGLKGKESVVIIKDAAAGQYTASAVVKVSNKVSGVTWATTLVVLSRPAPTPTPASTLTAAGIKPVATAARK